MFGLSRGDSHKRHRIHRLEGMERQFVGECGNLEKDSGCDKIALMV